MKNYEEKEKRLDAVLQELNLKTSVITDVNSDISKLQLQKNQLKSEKKEIENKYQTLLQEHLNLKKRLEKINEELNNKFDNQNQLNQETETLIDEIEKWQT